MGDKTRGLFGKFHVERVDKSPNHRDCDYFVLDLTHDPLALNALRIYAKDARHAGYSLLADDLEEKIAIFGQAFD